MSSQRLVLIELLGSAENLLAEAEPPAQYAQPDREQDRDSRRYLMVVRSNIIRIRRMLSDDESTWTWNRQHGPEHTRGRTVHWGIRPVECRISHVA